MRFYLGTHVVPHLAQTRVPLFLSRRRLADRKTFPRARGPWALDSGGFSELSMYGEWRTTPTQYVAEVRRFQAEIGGLTWAAAQDWMCEPIMLKKTGLTVAEHQRRTIDNYLHLRDLAPDLPWVPVLQGWELDEYRDHIEQYTRAGVSLSDLPTVGVGSVCRRQHTATAAGIFSSLSAYGLRLHGFGLKMQGLDKSAHLLTSADSLSWSFTARQERIRLPGCEHTNCANCLRWALRWHDKVLRRIHKAQRLNCPSPTGNAMQDLKTDLFTRGAWWAMQFHAQHGRVPTYEEARNEALFTIERWANEDLPPAPAPAPAPVVSAPSPAPKKAKRAKKDACPDGWGEAAWEYYCACQKANVYASFDVETLHERAQRAVEKREELTPNPTTRIRFYARPAGDWTCRLTGKSLELFRDGSEAITTQDRKVRARSEAARMGLDVEEIDPNPKRVKCRVSRRYGVLRRSPNREAYAWRAA